MPRADGGGEVSLASLEGDALVVVFLSVHCPYVKHVEKALGQLSIDYAGTALAMVGICANDVDRYPDDAPINMAAQAERCGWEFPYLHDETQQVALAYSAACTPDFFVYDAERALAYRGQFDETRPSTGVDATGASLRGAIDKVLAGEAVPEPHVPSAGCGIKWKPGNEPEQVFTL